MYLVINKCVTAVKVSNFSGLYLRKRSTLDIGVLGYIGIVRPKEHSPEVWSVPPVTPCILEFFYYTYVKFNLEQAMNAQRGNRSLSAHFNIGARLGWPSTPILGHFNPGRPGTKCIGADWALGPFRTGTENLASHRDSIPGPSSP